VAGAGAQAAAEVAARLSMIDIPRGKYIGCLVGDLPKDEAEHFMKCPACGGWFDRRDLGEVFDHVGPLPHPAEDKEQ
jgi:uncharacterized protein (DUF3820 family)